MHFQDFQSLLGYGESDWLDYKAALGPGIEQPGLPKEVRAHAQAELLKDLMCLANSPAPRRTRYLVRGVKDRPDGRHVVGAARPLDDADVQTWLEGRFDPPLQVQYWQWPRADGTFVGVFELRTAPGVVHVPARSLGQALVEGQVWWRRGSRNTLAGREGLQVLFGPPQPAPLVGWTFSDGGWDDRAFVDPQVNRVIQDGRAALPPRLEEAVAQLRALAARPLPSGDVPDTVLGLSGPQPAVPAVLDPAQVKVLRSRLAGWGVQVPAEAFQMRGVWAATPHVWPSPWQALGQGAPTGPGLAWYEAFAALVRLLDGHAREVEGLKQSAARPRVTLAVRNEGVGALVEGHLQLVPVGNLRFNFGVLARVLPSQSQREIRPGPSGSAQVMLGTLPPQGSWTAGNLPLERAWGEPSVLRYEVTARNLRGAVRGDLVIA